MVIGESMKSRLVTLFQYFLICLPAVIYLGFVIKYSQNMPRQDDYDAILGFLNDFRKAGSFSEKFGLVFSQHNEHRIFLSKFTALVVYKLAGAVNFRVIIFINFFILLFAFSFFVTFIKKLAGNLWHVAAIIAGTCFFNINGYENGNFAMAGTQNFGVIMLFIAGMFFYSKEHIKWLPLAALSQAVCVFTSGNGIIAAFFIVVYCILSRSKMAIIMSVITMIIFAPLYYYHYTKPLGNFFSSDPMRFLPFFVRVTGAHFGVVLSAIGGLSLMAVFLWLVPFNIRLKFEKPMLPFLCLSAFAFSSLIVLALFRNGLGIDSAYSSRYHIYSNILTAIVSIFILQKIRDTKLRQVGLAALMCGVLFFYQRNVKEGKGGFEYIYNNLRNNDYDYPDKTRAKMLADESCRLGIYCIGK
jgi:hypothetical protein